MKISKTITLIFLLSVLISIVVLLTNIFFYGEINYGEIIFAFVISFGICWLFIEKIIFKKIKNIYKAIHQIRELKDNTKKYSLNSNDILENTYQEVLQLTIERKDEMEELKKSETYRREFLGNVSHELKTPIFNIQGYINTLLDGGMEDKKIYREYLKRADKSVERMINIVEDLEAISQLESGELELDLEKFDIVSLSKDVIETLELRSKEKKITLSLLSDITKPIYVIADKHRIRQVLTNLIVNSIRYGKENGITRVRFNESDSTIFVEISDNGIGIAKTHLPRIFERFYRVDKSRSREQGGTGLGLSIVKHILEAHKQSINAISTEMAGSAFIFTLEKAQIEEI